MIRRRFNFVVATIIFAVFSSSVFPQITMAGENTQPLVDSEYNISIEDQKEFENLANIIREIESKIDLENFDNISTDILNSLSPEANEFYTNYQSTVNNAELNNQEIDLNELLKEDDIQLQWSPVFNVTEHKYSNKDVEYVLDKAKQVGLGGGLLTAIAAHFKKRPTALTLIIAAIGAIGVYQLEKCNSKGKGIVITDMRVGAMHTYSCYSQ